MILHNQIVNLQHEEFLAGKLRAQSGAGSQEINSAAASMV